MDFAVYAVAVASNAEVQLVAEEFAAAVAETAVGGALDGGFAVEHAAPKEFLAVQPSMTPI